MSVNLTIGDNSGTPPTGNVVYLYSAWTGELQIGEYPSHHNFIGGDIVKVSPALDGPGTIQEPVNDYRIREMVWETLDLDIFDISGGMIYELRQRKYSNTAQNYYMGATDLSGANFIPTNPVQIRIVDIITKPKSNSKNKKFADVVMKYQVV